MHYVGIDLAKKSLMVGVETEEGAIQSPRSFRCQDEEEIVSFFQTLRPFQAVVEASSSYRWLYDRLSPLGEVILAHPLQLRAIVSGRAKTDKIDAALLAKLLRGNFIPRAYVPPKEYEELRILARSRGQLVRRRAQARNELQYLLWRKNAHLPFSNLLCKKARLWVNELSCSPIESAIRQELLERIEHFDRAILLRDEMLTAIAPRFPQVEALQALSGIGLYSALLIVGEIGEPWRFPNGRKVGAYAGLTARVRQSGESCYYGHITRQGSAWLRWILVQAAMKIVRHDRRLGNFYARLRKRSSRSIARVAVARKLAEICWLRLMRWHRRQAA